MDNRISLHPATATWLRQSDLAEFVPAYCSSLEGCGYAATTRQSYSRCVAHFAHWLTQQRGGVRDMCRDDIDRFLDQHLPHCDCPAPVRRSRIEAHAALQHLWTVLCKAGIVAEDPADDAVEVELRRFDHHMLHNQGLASNTRAQRLRIVRTFLVQISGNSPAELVRIRASHLRRFIDNTLQRWSPASAHVLTSTLRSYLRFRAVGGDTVDHLFPIITSPANWRLAPLPEILSSKELTQLVDKSPAEGRSVHRSYAMLRCMIDLGLRASEVVALDLDDIDWCSATMRIGPTKSRRVDLLPLPQLTGRAIATYLRSERPLTNNRRVFVRHVAPFDKPIGPGVARRTVRDAFRRCGLPHTRVHVLRHSLAGRMLEGGATLKEVSDVLRHRSLDTTLIYAKIDSVRLAAVAMPWPEGVS